MSIATEKQIDRLALEGCDQIGFRSGTVLSYDMGGYDRVDRREVPPGSLESRDAPKPDVTPTPAEARFDDKVYSARMSGVRREHLFGPEKIGSLIARVGAQWNDSLGNGLAEALLIDRKYGFRHALEAPRLGFVMPFLEGELPAFEEYYRKRVARMAERLKELEPLYGAPLVGREEGQCILCTHETPLSLFWNACQRDEDEVKRELVEAVGRDTVPFEPAAPADRAALARFWSWVRRKHAQVLAFEAGALREGLGEGTRIIGNSHELPPLDLQTLGESFDAVGLAVRPALMEDDVLLRHYVSHYTQLVHDLSGKRPAVSVRVNLLGAGARFMPAAGLIRRWYDQAVRHGAGEFYFWTRDYPSDVKTNPYDGCIPGNPDPSTIPAVRWQATLDALGLLVRRRRFKTPPADVVILVPTESGLLHRLEWRRIYAAFAACAEARVHAGFVSDAAVARDGVPSGVKLLVAPVLEFVGPELREKIEGFTASGGALLCGDERCWDAEGGEAAPLAGAHVVKSGTFDTFPLEGQASLDALKRSTEWVKGEVVKREIDARSWVHDVVCENLPPGDGPGLREGDASVEFEHWLYEHSSNWILPYVRRE